MALIIDGTQEAARWRARIKADIAATDFIRPPGLKVILVGNDPASRAYVSRKAKAAVETGIDAELISLPESTTAQTLLELVDSLNADRSVHGILVQLPLPSRIPEKAVINRIAPEKDVDGFHPLNVGRLHGPGSPDTLLPCTPTGCMHLIRSTTGKTDLSGMTAAVIGRSAIVGKPMAALLLASNCTVMHLHSRTPRPASLSSMADIVVAAVGKPGLIDRSWIKEGATVIDVGINRVTGKNGKSALVGDVDFESVCKVAGAITPVPGGVGPMTVAGLMHNTFLAAKNLTETYTS